MNDEQVMEAIASMNNEEAKTYLGRAGYGPSSIKIFLDDRKAPEPVKAPEPIKVAPKKVKNVKPNIQG